MSVGYMQHCCRVVGVAVWAAHCRPHMRTQCTVSRTVRRFRGESRRREMPRQSNGSQIAVRVAARSAAAQSCSRTLSHRHSDALTDCTVTTHGEGATTKLLIDVCCRGGLPAPPAGPQAAAATCAALSSRAARWKTSCVTRLVALW